MFHGKTVATWAQRVLSIAKEGLGRRNQRDSAGQAEDIYLKDLEILLEKGRCPADEVLDALEQEPSAQNIVLATTA